MSFCVELKNISNVSRKKIIDEAIKSFEDLLKKKLLSQTEDFVNKGMIYVRDERNKKWYVDLQNILNSEKPPSDYYCPYSDIVYDFIIKNVKSNKIFNGVELSYNYGDIYFSWNLSSEEASITKELQQLFDKRKTYIVNEAKSEFNKLLREKMKFTAHIGLREGKFNDFSSYNFLLLKNLLKSDERYSFNKDYDVCEWLLNQTLKEQTDFNGIKMNLDDQCNIYFSW
jgi:hypothetical protein